MVEENGKNDFKLWVKSGLVVGAISVGGYWLGFAYERGYADYFAIPIQLISLNLISTFKSILGLFSVVGCIFLLANCWYMFFCDTGVIFRSINRLAPCALLFAGAFVIFGSSFWNQLKWLIPVLIFFLFDLFVLPLVRQRGKGTYYQRLEADEAAQQQIWLKTLFGFVAQKINLKATMWLIVAIVMLFAFAYWIGTAEAQKQKSFLIVREPMPLVVLRIYGDKFICAPFDSKARTVEKTLYILDTPKQDGIWLDWQEVGPLKPVDKKVSDVNN